jgi:hypothetical protein
MPFARFPNGVIFSNSHLPLATLWRCSSVGQSTRLISAASQVRLPPPPPTLPSRPTRFTEGKRGIPAAVRVLASRSREFAHDVVLSIFTLEVAPKSTPQTCLQGITQEFDGILHSVFDQPHIFRRRLKRSMPHESARRIGFLTLSMTTVANTFRRSVAVILTRPDSSRPDDLPFAQFGACLGVAAVRR